MNDDQEEKNTNAKPVAKANENLKSTDERTKRFAAGLLCIGLSAFAVVPFFFMGRSEAGSAFKLRMPITHDMFLHYDQMRSFYNGLAAGELYPRWEEDTNRGFGAPTTSYYPPGIYYLTSAFYAVTQDWLLALMSTHLVMMIAAAAALYFYARQSMGLGAAIAAMAAYIFLPYHLLDQYHRGAMAELLVFVWMPPMLLFGERLIKSSSSTRESSTFASVFGLAVTYGAFLWSHPPTAYQFTLGFGVYVVVLAVLRREWKGLISIGFALALGIGLASAYLLPAVIEQDLIHREYIAETWPYHKTYIFVHDLYNSDVHRAFFKLVDAIWISGTATIAVAGIVLLWIKRQAIAADNTLKQRVLLWILIGGLASFMMTSASMPVGKLIPKIDIGVFTWRMLSVTTLVVALLAGALTQAAVEAGKHKSRYDRALFLSLAALIVIGGAVFSAIAVARPMTNAYVFEPEPEHLNWATIPSSAPADPTELPDEVPQAELATSENGAVVVEEWKPEHRVLRASLKQDDQLLIRTFNFPGWTAAVDGVQVPIRSSEDLGSIEIEMPAGTHRITLDFLDTKPRRTFRIVSLSALVIVLGLGAASFVHSKKRIELEGN